jgi:hypothetical protein
MTAAAANAAAAATIGAGIVVICVLASLVVVLRCWVLAPPTACPRVHHVGLHDACESASSRWRAGGGNGQFNPSMIGARVIARVSNNSFCNPLVKLLVATQVLAGRSSVVDAETGLEIMPFSGSTPEDCRAFLHDGAWRLIGTRWKKASFNVPTIVTLSSAGGAAPKALHCAELKPIPELHPGIRHKNWTHVPAAAAGAAPPPLLLHTDASPMWNVVEVTDLPAGALQAVASWPAPPGFPPGLRCGTNWVAFSETEYLTICHRSCIEPLLGKVATKSVIRKTYYHHFVTASREDFRVLRWSESLCFFRACAAAAHECIQFASHLSPVSEDSAAAEFLVGFGRNDCSWMLGKISAAEVEALLAFAAAV